MVDLHSAMSEQRWSAGLRSRLLCYDGGCLAAGCGWLPGVQMQTWLACPANNKRFITYSHSFSSLPTLEQSSSSKNTVATGLAITVSKQKYQPRTHYIVLDESAYLKAAGEKQAVHLCADLQTYLIYTALKLSLSTLPIHWPRIATTSYLGKA